MPEYRRLKVRDCQGTLWAFYRQYEGQAVASFEGDLSNLKLEELPGATTQETDTLRRQTIQPELDFIVVPINQETIRELKCRLSTHGVLGRHGAVIHTQLAVRNELILIACDNFHDDCTTVSMAVPESFLKRMQSHGLLRTYSDV
jgi:hypothetical protein